MAVIVVEPINSFNPERNPVPLMVKVWAEFEPVIGFGLNVVMAGAAVAAFTVRLTELLAWPLGLVTCTARLCALDPTLTPTTNCEPLTK